MTPKKPATPKKPRGRPRKNGHGRKGVFVYLPVDLLAELNAYVRALRVAAGSDAPSRGDVLSAALRSFRPFRRRKA
jgi:hypothetical protein